MQETNQGIRQDWNGILLEFVRDAPAAARHHALESLGRSLLQSKEPISPELTSRLCRLWEWWEASVRPDALDLAAFGWWFGSPIFDVSWSLAVLGRVLDLTHGRIDRDHGVAKRLAALAAQRPADVVDCLAKFIDGGNESRVSRCQNALRDALGTLLRTEGASGAKAIVSRLVARGHLEFRDLEAGR